MSAGAVQSSRTFRSAVLGLGQALTGLAGLLTLAVLARLLSVGEYGSYRQVFLVYGMVVPIASLGLPTALYYFLSRHPGECRPILSGNLAGLGVLGVIVFTALTSGGAALVATVFKNPALDELLRAFAPYILFSFPILAIGACLVTRQQIRALIAFNVGSRLLMLAGAVTPVLVTASAVAAIKGVVAASAVSMTIGVALMYAVCRDGPWLPKATQVASQLRYAVPISMAGAIGIVAVHVDKVLVSSLLSPERLAVYANGAMELPLIGVVTGSVTAVLLPELSALFKRNDALGALRLWHGAMVKCAVLLVPVAVFCFVLAPEIMRLVFSDRYTDSATPFRLYLLALPMRVTSFGAMPLAAGDTAFTLRLEIVSSTANIALGFLMMYLLGPDGAALGVVLSLYLVTLTGSLYWIRRRTGADWLTIMPWVDLARVATACLLPVPLLLMSFLVPGGDLPRVVVLGALYGSAVLWIVLRWNLGGARAMAASMLQGADRA